MKKINFLIKCVVNVFLVAFCIAFLYKPVVGQNNPKPPYPIIFVHGWEGTDTAWMDDNGNWKTFFESFGWSFGGQINICLESLSGDLDDEANSDVSLSTNNTLIAGDFYMINFDINRSGIKDPDLNYLFNPFNSTAITITLHSNNEGDINHLQIDDILVAWKPDFVGVINEYMKIVSINYNTGEITVDRPLFGSTSLNWSLGGPVEVKNHASLSNQASIVKGGLGVKIAVEQVCQLNNRDKVILVCHSMGGLNARQYIQSNDYNDSVAKLVTISSPHLGSNTSDLGIFIMIPKKDQQSDAVRDMRYSLAITGSEPPDPPYGDEPDNAVFLFGGHENSNWGFGFNWYSLDFNGDGEPSTSNIEGLNINSNWPNDVLFHCCIGFRLFYGTDDVVRADRQYPWPNIFPDNFNNIADNLDTSWVIGNPLCIYHMIVQENIAQCMRGLDEPNVYDFAYKIIPGTTINGFTTFQRDVVSNDYDWYKFVADVDGNATVEINVSNNPTNYWVLKIYKDTLNGPSYYYNYFLDNNSNTNQTTFPINSGMTYYLRFNSHADEDSYQHPYALSITTTFVPEVTQINVISNDYSLNISEQSTITATVLDQNSNPIANETLTFSSNNNGYFTGGIGNDQAITNGSGEATITYTPTSTGNHMITATAQNNVSGQLPQPISVSDPNSGHDIAVQTLTLNHYQVDPGDNVTATAQVKNVGTEVEYNIPIEFKIFKPNGQLHDQESVIIPQLNPNQVTNPHPSASLSTSSTQGFYQVTAEATNAFDADYSNNYQSTSVYVGDPQDSEEYETQADFLVGGGACHVLYGINICLLGANPNEAYFKINNQNITVDIDHIKLLWGGTHIIAYDTYYNSSLGSVYYYFGPASNELTVSPGTGVGLQGQTIQYNVTAPNGWDFINNNNQEFSFVGPGGSDNTYFEQWLEFDESIADNHIVYNCNIPNDATPRTYAAWIGNDVYKPNDDQRTLFKLWRLQVEPDFHDLAAQINNPSNNSQFNVGDNVQIDYDISNNGSYSEVGYYELTITGPMGYQYNEGDNINITANSTQGFQYNWNTQGLNSGNYNITVNVVLPNDDVPSNNTDQISVELQITAPQPPNSVTVDRNNLCADDPGDITLSANGGSGQVLKWYTGSCGGTEIGTGITLTISSPETSTSYYARWENGNQYSTCGSVDVNIYLQLASGTISQDQTICYNTSPNILDFATNPSGGEGNYSYQWKQSYDMATWNNITGAITTIYTPGPLTITTYYMVEVTDNCGTVLTNIITITVYDDMIAAIIGNDQDICYNTIPNEITTLNPATGGEGNYTYQWYESFDIIQWNLIANATCANYQPVALTDTTYYKLETIDNCGIVESNVVMIGVYDEFISGTIGQDQVICYNTVPAELTSTVLPSGGEGNYSYQWQDSIIGGIWDNINGANSYNYQPVALTDTTYYRLIVEDICDTLISNEIQISVYDELMPGIIGSDQTICYNTLPADISLTDLPTGGDCTYSYQWQDSTNNNNWSNIAGATSISYSPGLLTETTYYRLEITSGSGCGTVYTNFVTITVYDDLTPSVIGDDQTICYNTTPAELTTINLTTGGTGQYTYQWNETGDIGSGWNIIAGAVGLSYQPGLLTDTTYYMVEITDPCGIIYSNIVTINVYAPVTSAFIGVSQSICYNTAPSELTTINFPTGGEGNYTYQWQDSVAGVIWTDINGANSANYQPGLLTDTTYYRLIVEDLCDTLISNEIEIVVYDEFNAGLIGYDTAICYNTAPDPLIFIISPSGGEPTGFTYWWEINTGYGWNSLTAYDSTYSPGQLTQTTSYRCQVGNTCGSLLSNEVTITVMDELLPGTIGIDQSICYNTVPDELTSLTLPSGGDGIYTYQWQDSTASTTVWTNITGAIDTNYSPGALTETTYYRLIATNLCGVVYSNIVTIEVYDDLVAAVIGIDQSICYNTMPDPITIITGISGGFGNYTYQWQDSTSTHTWEDINGATQNSYAPGYLIETTAYRLVISDMCGTVISNNIIIEVYEDLSTGAIGESQSICSEDIPEELTIISAFTGGQGNYLYQWQDSTYASGVWQNISGANDTTYQPGPLNVTTYYRLKVTDTCGTMISNRVTITVNPWATVNIIIEASSEIICFGDTVTFTATPTYGGSDPEYQWYLNGSSVGENSPTYITNTLINSDEVYCVLNSSMVYLCIAGNPATSNTIVMTVNYPPDPPGLPIGPTYILIDTTFSSDYYIQPLTNADSYEWFVEPEYAVDSIINNDTIGTFFWNVYFYFDTAFIYVRAINECGEGEYSNKLPVYIDYYDNIYENIYKNLIITVFPNPTKGELTISVKGVDEPIYISLVNINGRLIFTDKFESLLTEYKKIISITNLPMSIYYLKIQDMRGLIIGTEKIIKIR